MSNRETESTTVSSCTFESECWVTPHEEQPWEISQFRREESCLPCSRLEAGTTVRIAPMTKQYGGWNEDHFHSNLRLPIDCNVGKGIVVLLEALARECVAVALSPDADFVLGKTYVTHYGASGNVSTVIRRRLPADGEAVDAQFVSRVCSEESWISYWLCLTSTGKVFAGIGKTPGEKCIGAMDDSLYHQLRSGQDAVRFVGLSNSALGKQARPLKVRNVVVTTVPDTLHHKLDNMSTENFSMINVEDDQDEESKAMMEAYSKECKKAMARAKKFGIEYKEPNPQAFLNWSKARRLRANPQKGFATGMDISAPEELEKQRVRAERFGISKDKRSLGDAEEDIVDAEKEENPIEKEPIPVEQAWDNGKLTRPHRIDPPKTLWVNPPNIVTEEENYATEESEAPSLVPEKIHLCSIDWAAFKQIRTDDIMAHFSMFGPTYVEWLGELSCNIHFQDQFSAARALQSLSQQLPSPAPESVRVVDDIPDLGSMGWALCCQPIRKTTNDRFGRRGTTARYLLRVAASTDVLLQKPMSAPAPPRGFSTKRILGPGSESDKKHEKRPNKRRKKARRESKDQTNTNPDGDHPLLSKGLKAGRDGYSIEDMEAERSLDVPGEDSELANADTPIHENLEI